ncbi:MAG: hypothetical protein SGILL_006254, partial [Bacillariaceae sp.]
ESDPPQQSLDNDVEAVASPNGPQAPPLHSDTIPENLLSLAKDSRYVQQCQELLSEFCSNFLQLVGAKNSDDDDRNSSSSSLQKQTWITSYALYVIFVVAPMGRTLGMQALGLTFGGSGGELATNSNTQNRQNLARSMLAACGVAFAMECYNYHYKRKHETSQQSSNGIQGRSRRELHERLRQQMLARAANGASNSAGDAGASRQTGATTGATSAASSSFSGRIQSIFHRVSTSILKMAFHHEGPHEIAQSDNTTTTNTTYSMAIWLVRLHLVQHLVTGKYPTILHRLMGLKLQGMNVTTSQSTAIPFRPNSQRVIALLILIQASSTAVRNGTNWSARLVANYLEKRSRRVTVSTIESPEMQLQRSMTRFFNQGSSLGAIPEIHDEGEESDSSDTDSAVDHEFNDLAEANNSSATKCATLCTICRTPRKHPAAPASCGHVCCWNCLNQWVINVRPECPLCRAPCKPQEVIALHHYEPVKEDENDI